MAPFTLRIIIVPISDEPSGVIIIIILSLRNRLSLGVMEFYKIQKQTNFILCDCLSLCCLCSPPEQGGLWPAGLHTEHGWPYQDQVDQPWGQYNHTITTNIPIWPTVFLPREHCFERESLIYFPNSLRTKPSCGSMTHISLVWAKDGIHRDYILNETEEVYMGANYSYLLTVFRSLRRLPLGFLERHTFLKI
jgi:hypothetical protein